MPETPNRRTSHLLAALVIVASAPLGLGPLPHPGEADPVGPAAATQRVTTDEASTGVWARGVPAPDAVDSRVGGIAARIHLADGSAVPNRLFTLMGARGSELTVRVYVETPFTHEEGTFADTEASAFLAAEIVSTVVDGTVQPLSMTTPPAGGASVGLPYAIAHLDLFTNGAFSDLTEMAATGTLARGGYVMPVSAVDEKAVAAHAAGVRVLFTPSLPSAEILADLGAHVVGELTRGRRPHETLAEERRWSRYEMWGRQANGFTVVGVRHVGDVAAWLCGAGSASACEIADRFNALEREVSPVATTVSPVPAGLAGIR